MSLSKPPRDLVLKLLYLKIHVPSMLVIGVETIKKQTQQTNKQPQWRIKFIKHNHKGTLS